MLKIPHSLLQGIIGAKVKHNYCYSPSADCPRILNGSVGIVISGADKSEVKDNTVKGYQVGISLTDDDATKEIAEGNKIIGNRVLESTSVDIKLSTNGTGNVAKKNTCTSPGDLCNA
jgi:nitrous oxidase accessory protein NosD